MLNKKISSDFPDCLPCAFVHGGACAIVKIFQILRGSLLPQKKRAKKKRRESPPSSSLILII